MQELASRGYVGNHYEIEVLDNGFLLTGGVPRKKEAHFSFSALVNALAKGMWLVSIGETIKVSTPEKASEYQQQLSAELRETKEQLEMAREHISHLQDEIKNLQKGILDETN